MGIQTKDTNANLPAALDFTVDVIRQLTEELDDARRERDEARRERDVYKAQVERAQGRDHLHF